MDPSSTRDYSRLEGTAFSRTRMRGLRTMVVGAGALGNEVIKQLALLGVGQLIVVDRDHIEASNLTRSVLFCTPGIDAHVAARTPKARFAAIRASELNPDVEATGIVAEIADVGLSELRAVDIVFGCLDSELARLELGWAALRADRPLVDGGLSVTAPSNGMVALYPGSRGPCYLCRVAPERRRALLWELQGREDPCWVRERRAEQANTVSTTPLTSAVVAALQVEIGLRFAPGEETARAGIAHRISLHPSPSIENRVFTRSENCPMHEADDVLSGVSVREGRSSTRWRVADLLQDVVADPGQASLLLDWPITVRARCESCRHEWEPMMRRARFRRSTCPACGAHAVVECESVAEIEAASPWAERTLSSLGLPPAHVHSVVQRTPAGVKRHFVVPGDDLAAVPEGAWP